MRGEEYVEAAAELEKQVVAAVVGFVCGRLTEEEAVAEVKAIEREAEGVRAVAAAELVITNEQNRQLQAVLDEQERRIRELRGELG
ncbi:hypothetical protein AB0K09_28320 [Streptomyces sp. NPDC049577]|uniref:hypothetical protein n=1 Tax=Streptomyces sp. NPDC049577 TaxID=3155153 RepID=UPI003420740A